MNCLPVVTIEMVLEFAAVVEFELEVGLRFKLEFALLLLPFFLDRLELPIVLLLLPAVEDDTEARLSV